SSPTLAISGGIDSATLATSSLASSGGIDSATLAASGGIDCATLATSGDLRVGSETEGFRFTTEGESDAIETQKDLLLQPAAGAKIIPATMMEFPDDVGDKIRFFSHAYAIGISPFDLDYRSDLYHKWHSDTNEDAMILNGDTGDLTIGGDFHLDTGDFYGPSGSTLNFLSQHGAFEWGTPSDTDIVRLDAGSKILYLDSDISMTGHNLNISGGWIGCTSDVTITSGGITVHDDISSSNGSVGCYGNITSTNGSLYIDNGGATISGNTWIGGDCSALSFTDRCEYPGQSFDALDAIAKIRKIGDENEEWGDLDHDSLPPHLIKSAIRIEKKYRITNQETSQKMAEIPIRLVADREDITDITELLDFVDISPELVPLMKVEYVEEKKTEKGRDLGGMVSVNSKAISQLLNRVKSLE
ncbi:MAG: hypothetical protein ACP5I1_20675, partial [Candidatus Hinthialibacter sp.]